MDKSEYRPYNPLSKESLGNSIMQALMSSEAVPITQLQRFTGAGIYALFYRSTAPFMQYERYAKKNRKECRFPIYVGKAVQAGARKGMLLEDEDPGPVLYQRLSEHAESLKAAQNLSADDFMVRYLCLDNIWIPLGETLLISQFSPLWNVYVDGFGNHNPGAGRRNQLRSQWDMIHPGRAWAEQLKERDRDAMEKLLKSIPATLAKILH